MPTLTTFIQHSFGSSCHDSQIRKIKGIQIRKEEVKLLLFEMILYMENSSDAIKNCWNSLKVKLKAKSLRNRTEEPGGLLSMGSHRFGHDWSDLAVAAAYGKLIYNKGASMYNGEKTPSLANSAGKSYMQKNQSGLLFHKTHKSSLQMN